MVGLSETGVCGVLLFPPVLFGISLLIGYALFKFGESIAPATKKIGYKLKMYACGEDFHGKKFQPTYNLFFVAFFFTVLHASALMLATLAYSDMAILVGLIYALVLVISMVALVRSIRLGGVIR